jgi:hypothetical protein
LGIEHQQNQQQSSYFVDSVEGCTLLAMLVEQIQTKLPSISNLEHGNVENHHQEQNDDEGDGHSIEGKEALGHHRIGGLVMDDGQGSSGSGDEDRRWERFTRKIEKRGLGVGKAKEHLAQNKEGKWCRCRLVF